uniref:Uncharacterized protein n=1 Tax=Pyramimonas obovata TaxID=1411642 RepID=A0A7S0RFQ8_9CHLO
MDPRVNPAHHRYLEVQVRASGVNGRPAGPLWRVVSGTVTALMTVSIALNVLQSVRTVSTGMHGPNRRSSGGADFVDAFASPDGLPPIVTGGNRGGVVSIGRR